VGVDELRSTKRNSRPQPVLLLWVAVWAMGLGRAASGAPAEKPGAAAITTLSRDEIERLIGDGRYAAAEQQARLLLESVEGASPLSSLETARVLDLLVEALWRDGRGRLPESRALAERALAIKQGALGNQSPELARSLRNLGTVLEESGDPVAARSLYERAIDILERAFGPRHPEIAVSLIDLANLFVNTGDDPSARALYERALAIQERASATDDPAVTRTLHNLALLHYRAGDYATAEAQFERTLAMKERIFGREHPDVAWTLDSLAIVLKETGDYPRARALYERALAIRETVLGPDHLQVGYVLNNLGILLYTTGDHAESASCFERALVIEEKVLGPEHSDVATIHQNLGDVYRLAGDVGRARTQYEQALAVRMKTIGPNRPAVAESLNALASVLSETGERDRARSLYGQALEAWRASLGEDHPEFTLGLRGLALLHMIEGDLAGARPLLEQALRTQQKALGPDHPSVAESLGSLGEVLARTGDVERALEYALRAEEIGRNQLKLTTRTLSDREALRYASVRPSGLNITLVLAGNGLGSVARKSVWDALIRSRALVLEEMVFRRQLGSHAGDPDFARLQVDLVRVSRRLANLTTRGPGSEPPETYRSRVAVARREKERAERALAAKSAHFERERARDRIGFKEVAASLPSTSALVAFARCQGLADNGASYLAFVLRGKQDEPAIVPLGSAAEIDSLILRWAEETGRGPLVAGRSLDQADTFMRSAGTALRRRIWDPLLRRLGTASRIFVVHDGTLHLVTFAALPVGTKEYLIESGPIIHYLSSERDIVAFSTPRKHGEGLLALGGPAFDEAALQALPDHGAGGRRRLGDGAAPSSSTFRGARPGCPDFRSIHFMDLPASAREVDEIVSLWRGPTGEGASVAKLTGPHASEAAFKAEAPGRRVLHVATHGFFLGGRCRAPLRPERGIGGLAPEATERPAISTAESPLLLSGLALAGANRRQVAGLDEEDGILTAEEMSAMDLNGVDWAVLSACDTGVGELASGEGVLGLRRSLEVAGVATVIMSLWSVDDEAALEWMRALYQGRLVRGLSTSEAVRTASLNVLRRRRETGGTTHPFYWAGFVAAGDWR